MASMSNSQLINIQQLLQSLTQNNVDTQINASALLQHLTYQNENNKEIIRYHNGIRILISILNSRNSICQLNAAGVLRNLSHGPNIEIKKQMEECGIIEMIECLSEKGHQFERRLTETLIAIICNLSCCSIFQVILANSALSILTNNILLPFLGLKINSSTRRVYLFKISDLTISYCPLLEYMTAFYKNLSSGPRLIRQQMRGCEGLVDSIMAIIQHSFDNDNFNCKIVENCICTVRNLCYSLQELYNPAKLDSDTKTQDVNISNNVHINNPRQLNINSIIVLWDTEMIDMLLEFLNDCKNNMSVEAALGTIQNLAAPKWHMADEFRFNFRKKKGLPAILLHVINGSDEVVMASIIALRNLAEDKRNLDLIGDHGLVYMINCLPSPGNIIIKRKTMTKCCNKNYEIFEDCLSLDTIHSILSFIYYIMQKKTDLCEIFVKRNAFKNCFFLLKSDAFYRDNLSDPRKSAIKADKIPILSATILRFIWNQSKLRSFFKQEKLSCEDFCIPSWKYKIRTAIACSTDHTTLYYGQPYVKARSNTLLPHNYQISSKMLKNSQTSDEEEFSQKIGNQKRPTRDIDEYHKHRSKTDISNGGQINIAYLHTPIQENKIHMESKQIM